MSRQHATAVVAFCSAYSSRRNVYGFIYTRDQIFVRQLALDLFTSEISNPTKLTQSIVVSMIKRLLADIQF